LSINEATVNHLDDPIAGTITARIYKGICASGDNMIIEVDLKDYGK